MADCVLQVSMSRKLMSVEIVKFTTTIRLATQSNSSDSHMTRERRDEQVELG